MKKDGPAAQGTVFHVVFVSADDINLNGNLLSTIRASNLRFIKFAHYNSGQTELLHGIRLTLSVIHECQETLPDRLQYATFDTSFHASMPDYAYTYPVPKSIRERFRFRKYGFHGLSYAYISRAAPVVLGLAPESLKMVVCHLGTGGSSVSAIRNGLSI